ncbi:hypothetical protein QFC19_001431 [Naganishia cerealis]|uniref:Uncharacterized protein n=1 Tax=Naganishia cerealis TaxID=610337 RepID=A0ACC2WIL8_9TREE|nr:hypothetical protein QFC19_001431 [Naganishia cerealis]
MSPTTYILAINCGSSSIKAKLYKVGSAKRQPLTAVAEGSVKGIGAKGQKIKIKLEWLDGSGDNVSEEGELGDKGLVGGTRSGTIDPTLVFHLVKECAEDAGLDGIKVTRAEATLNKKSGLTALAGTNDFNSITTKMLDPSSHAEDDAKASTLAYKVYTDRLLCYLTFYLSKLFETEGVDGIDGLVFSGGIGEKSVFLRKDIGKRLGWMGFEVDDKLNDQASAGKEVAVKINAASSKIPIWVVQTDEEEVCAKMVQECFDL